MILSIGTDKPKQTVQTPDQSGPKKHLDTPVWPQFQVSYAVCWQLLLWLYHISR